ncbi:tetratricopeptide repeat protein [Vibrio tapetis]|nr:tetratricopeptide repeat protein [Vibrio tapetis]
MEHNKEIVNSDFVNLGKEYEILYRLAKDGDAVMQYYLAEAYYKKGYNELAIDWYHKSVEQGYAPAQYHLSRRYLYGKGVTQDNAHAMHWMQQSAKQEYLPAQSELGILYAQGEAVSQNNELAKYWTKKAADRGYANAQFNLAIMYHMGTVVPKDREKALYWFEKSAAQGDEGAQFHLGTYYANGITVKQDGKKALYWFRQAANSGYAFAQFNLGLIYFNLEEHSNALLWLLVSKLNGYDASNAIKIVHEYLTTEAIRNAENMSKKCVESDYLMCDEL